MPGGRVRALSGHVEGASVPPIGVKGTFIPTGEGQTASWVISTVTPRAWLAPPA